MSEIMLNPDGTLPNKPESHQEMVTFTTTYKACPHDHGWYFSVKFLFWTKRLYWCDLCCKAFDAKFIRLLLNNHPKN